MRCGSCLHLVQRSQTSPACCSAVSLNGACEGSSARRYCPRELRAKIGELISAGSPRGHIEMVDGIYYEFIWFPMKLRIDFGSQGGSPSAHKCSFGSTKKFTLMFPTGTSPDDTSFARV